MRVVMMIIIIIIIINMYELCAIKLVHWWNEDWQGKPKYSEKTYPSATLSTNPT
jgi:cellulose synthase/poly-beta-1,6-N-acetylglucosamine synthase-like glycosyltransferase